MTQRSENVRAAVVGATGYTGAELMRLLANHPAADPTVVTGRADAGRALSALFPQLGRVGERVIEEFDADRIAETSDVAFLALPHGAAAECAAQLLDREMVVIDLSADFRLRDPQSYAEWYGDHPCPERITDAVYGLPERYRTDIGRAHLIACPGCYPTATLLAVLPLLEAGLTPKGIIADCKSGTTGAGRAPRVDTLLAEAGEAVTAYGVGYHRHQPEIAQEVERAARGAVPVTFTPHLVPMARGILATVYVDTSGGLSPNAADLWDLYRERYADEPFVEVLEPGSAPSTGHVRGTNRALVSVTRHPSGQVIALCAIDNLVKGAAGQAIQCMNLRFGLPENTGLFGTALFP